MVVAAGDPALVYFRGLPFRFQLIYFVSSFCVGFIQWGDCFRSLVTEEGLSQLPVLPAGSDHVEPWALTTSEAAKEPGVNQVADKCGMPGFHRYDLPAMVKKSPEVSNLPAPLYGRYA
jgi:hypothetical protein